MMGGIYGMLFGWMDIEDSDNGLINIKILQEEKYCLIIGILLGGFGGIVNELIRRNVRNEGIYEIFFLSNHVAKSHHHLSI